MKIFVAGSMAFAREILDAQCFFQAHGHEALVASDTEECLKNPNLTMDAEHCFTTDIMRDCMDRQEQCDAIVVLNYPKDGVAGYIGAHVLIELGLAYYLKQKIFLLYPPAPVEVSRHSFEILHMRPITLEGDLRKSLEYIQAREVKEETL